MASIAHQEAEKEEATTISAVHPDILLTHIFTRLDVPDLASVSCASSHLRLISTQQSLWSDICRATWPSTNDPRMHDLISNYPRSFFSDSFPLLLAGAASLHLTPTLTPPPELISTVDIHYKNNCVFSKVHQTETLTSWFRCSPFRIDLLDKKHTIRTPIQSGSFTCEDLEEDLRLSWIVVDPSGRRASNVSSRRAVSVQQHWLSGEIQLKFATIMAGADHRRRRSPAKELVLCNVVVTCGRCGSVGGGGEVIEVREVSLVCEDMEGASLNGKESLEILQRSMRFGRRERARKGDEGRESYLEYLKRKEEKEEKVRREGVLDSMCKAVVVAVVAAFCTCSLFLLLCCVVVRNNSRHVRLGFQCRESHRRSYLSRGVTDLYQ